MASDGLNGWHVVAFLLGILVSVIVVTLIYFRMATARARREECASSPHGSDAAPRAAWADVEKGKAVGLAPREPGDKVLVCSPRQFRETLRQLLESELPRGLTNSGLLEQLQRLEEKVQLSSELARTVEVRSEGRAATEGLRAVANAGPRGADTATPQSGRGTEGGPPSEGGLPGAVPAPEALPHAVPPPRIDPPEALGLPAPPACRPQTSFGPTDRQLALPDPPEKCAPSIDVHSSLEASLATVQKVLGRRDAQTAELHRQLKEARQCLWEQTAEARAATAKLQELLTDPSRGPAMQAETIRELQVEVRDLAGRLADARAQERHWSAIARRQRAFFLQSERLGQEGLLHLRRHPCGEVFLVPPPVAAPYEEDDAAAGQDGPGWDVGKSHCNPYKVDSWPFEPNVLAQRPSKEPNLQQWVEGEDEDDHEDERVEEHSDDNSLEECEEGDGPEIEDSPMRGPAALLSPKYGDMGSGVQDRGSETARSL